MPTVHSPKRKMSQILFRQHGYLYKYLYTHSHQCFGFLLFLLALQVNSLSVSPRHVCLLNSYDSVRGPYFTALLDQLAEQAGHVDNLKLLVCYDNETYDSKHLQQIQNDIPFLTCDYLLLADYNPLSLYERLAHSPPNIIWLYGSNAFTLRYHLRTSGCDRWIHNHCAGSVGSQGCVYVGERAGALVAGTSLRVARYPVVGDSPDDPKGVPEPQFFGLGLLGLDRTVAFTTMSKEEQATLRSSHYDFHLSRLALLETDQVYVWSQSSSNESTSVTNFVFLATRRGTMEQIMSPEPLLPLVQEESEGGVECFGEPSIDPSRKIQSIGDSEWLEYEVD